MSGSSGMLHCGASHAHVAGGRREPAAVPERLISCMRFILLVLAGLALGGPVLAQEPPVSSANDQQSSTPKEQADLPVSLDRIREGLKKTPEQPLLQGLDRTADF